MVLALFHPPHTTNPRHHPPPDVDGWLKYASLCRKSGRPRQAERMLVQLLHYDPRSVTTPHTPGFGAGSGAPAVMLAFVKHLWATGSRPEALARLQVGRVGGWLVWGACGSCLAACVDCLCQKSLPAFAEFATNNPPPSHRTW